MATAINPSEEYHAASSELRRLKVDQLKQAIAGFNDTFHGGARYHKLSGNKQELVQRIQQAMLDILGSTSSSRITQCKHILVQAGGGSVPPSPQPPPRASTSVQAYSYAQRQAVAPAPPAPATNSRYGYNPQLPAYNNPQQANNATAYGLHQPTSGAYGFSHHQHGYNGGPAGLPPPRFAGGATAGGSVQSRAQGWENSARDTAQITFKSNPLFKVVKHLAPQATILIKANPGDRKNYVHQFTLSDAHRELLRTAKESPSNTQYRVYLFCTSEDYYNPTRPSSQAPAPIDFPAVCEIKINNSAVTANTKGIKKQAGTAPPVDLGKAGSGQALSLTPGTINRVEITYLNTEKRYFALAFLVEAYSVKQAVDRVKTAPIRTKESVIADIVRLNSDDDIDATAQGLSLKDPLTFARIKTPIRSRQCTHISCFDAEVFVMMNEQTPSWNCPICSKTLQFDQLQVDGFFQSILAACPSSIDEVTVEPDGTWRSSDDRFGTAKPRSTAPSRDASLRPDAAATNGHGAAPGGSSHNGGSSRYGSPSAEPKGKARSSAAIDLSSDDDDGEPLAKRPRFLLTHNGANGYGSSVPSRMQEHISVGSSSPPAGGGSTPRARTEVLDLTLSSDEDDDGPLRVPPPRPRPVIYATGSATGSANGSASGSAGGGLSVDQLAVKRRLEERGQLKDSEERDGGW